MLSLLASHNQDIDQLIKKGYALSVDSNYLVVRDIPYLDKDKQLQIGAIVSKLVDQGQNRITIDDHQIFFCGTHPCELDGQPIKNLGGGPTRLHLTSEDLVVQRSFSNKPQGGFKNWFDKIESYVQIISGPAMTIYGTTPYTYRLVEEKGSSVFNFRDVLSSRAEIGDLSAQLEQDRVAIIGLGGTGVYVLDFLVKTPVKEIRGFDLDWFHVHNAFRSPGKLDEEELGQRKAEVYQSRYENFRSGINISPKFITSESLEDLKNITFAFVCVDKGSSRGEIFNLLVKLKIPFIDVGMGLSRDNGTISGTLRTTYYDVESAQELIDRKLSPLTDLQDDEYRTNIQISELNAFNACQAVIKYKQIRGFYSDDEGFIHSLFTVDSTKCFSE